MSKKRGKRPGLRARSKNARTVKPRMRREKSLTVAAIYRPMVFHTVESGAPEEGKLVLVRLRDNTYRFGMVFMGRFANYEYTNEEFVTFAHPERITHWMEVDPPVPLTAKAEEQTPEAEHSPPSIMDAALAAGEAQDRAEDVYV